MTSSHPEPGVSTAPAGAPAADRVGGEDPGAVALSVRGLDLAFGSQRVVSGIDLDIPRGRITALIGPSGSGKSTFLRTVNRMNDHVPGFRATGVARYDGVDILRPDIDLVALRRRVGMLFQRPNPFPMSIADNVVAGVRAHGIAKRAQWPGIIEARLREVRLWEPLKDRLKESPFGLSGGQQQLLCLARALAVGPDVVLLDEPTSALDPISMQAIEDLLRDLTPALTMIIVTHNLAQARRLSDCTMFFNQGRLVEFGDTVRVFEDPAEEETERYVSGRIG